MKRLLYLAALTAAATLTMASAASAQGVPPSGGSGPYGCPETAPFPATLAGDPGEGSLRCFPSQAEANEYSAGGTASPEASASPESSASPEASASPEPVASPEPSASPGASASPEPTEALPETGGPGGSTFALPAAALLVAGGLLGLRVARRRS